MKNRPMTRRRPIAVAASFDTTLKGPLAAVDTTHRLSGSRGPVQGQLD